MLKSFKVKSVFKLLGLREKRERWLFVALVLYVVGIAIYTHQRKKMIAENFSITGGKIVDYYTVGDLSTEYTKYEYEVEGHKYYREFDSNNGIDSCYNNLCNCQKYRLLVIYSNEDHSKSLINLKRKYIKGENIDKKALNLDDFD